MLKKLIIGIICILPVSLIAQDFTFVPHTTYLSDTLNSEMIYEIDITNTSTVPQTVYIKRTDNNLPADWTSALCFEFCFASFVDSIATTATYGSSPLNPGETRTMSLHIFPLNNHGTGYVTLEAATFADPTNIITSDFTAVTQPASVEDLNITPEKYFLSQNYPNPFNPSTQIEFGIRESGYTLLKVYNLLGVEVKTLVDGYLPSGSYRVPFDALNLSSGIYFYRISTRNFVETKKMILEK